MNQSILQLLLLLGYLAIGLIAVTFPIYAICVNYLRQEKSESKKEQKTRAEHLKQQIDEQNKALKGLDDEIAIKTIKEKIENFQNEKKALELRTSYLTVKGAVRNPVIVLILALATAAVSIYYFDYDLLEVVIPFGSISALLSGYAIYSLYCTLCAVEYAALRALRTVEFSANFDDHSEKMQIVSGKEVKLGIGAGSDEDDIENFVLHVYIPSEIELREVLSANTYVSFQKEGWAYPNHNLVYMVVPFNSRGVCSGITLKLLAKNKGEFKIPVKVKGKGIYESKFELTLDVV